MLGANVPGLDDFINRKGNYLTDIWIDDNVRNRRAVTTENCDWFVDVSRIPQAENVVGSTGDQRGGEVTERKCIDAFGDAGSCDHILSNQISATLVHRKGNKHKRVRLVCRTADNTAKLVDVLQFANTLVVEFSFGEEGEDGRGSRWVQIHDTTRSLRYFQNVAGEGEEGDGAVVASNNQTNPIRLLIPRVQACADMIAQLKLHIQFRRGKV